ncbi:MAG: spermidine synthase family protein [Bacillota bacterium]
MTDWPATVVERRMTPRGEIQLHRRGDEFEIIENGVFIMATWNRTSERAMVTMALGRRSLGEPRGLRVLVAGLGVGYSLRAALDDPRVTRVDVVEIDGIVAAWNRGPLAAYNGAALDDPRVRLHLADFVDWVAGPAENAAAPLRDGGGSGDSGYAYDLVVMDIDNGPDWLVFDANRRLYEAPALAAVAARTKPGGLVAVWSATRSDPLHERLRGQVGPVTTRVLREDGASARKLPPTYVYIARKAAPRAKAAVRG